jgi:gamma-glutamylcyclotransferase (GGCT)/AIG2-like uncharacterized protein YtfP
VNTIFVYGLLKPGLRLHHLVEPFVVRSAPGRVRGRLYDAGVPAARFDEDGEIEGFVFWLDGPRWDEALRILDDLEDEGTEYRRIVVPVTTDDGSVDAQAYEYLRPLDGCRDVGSSWDRPSG